MEENEMDNIYSTILFVADLPKEIIKADLENLFVNYNFINILINKTNPNKIWAKVIFDCESIATKARHELNGFFLIPQLANKDKLKGRAIRICKYKPKNIHNNIKNIDNDRNLLIKNLDIKMNQMEFYNIFLKYGDISSGKIEYDENGISKGFGYIYYYDKKSAEKAKNELNNKEYYGKKIQIVNLIPSEGKNDNKNKTVFAFNVPKNITENEISPIFDKYGEIEKIFLTNKGYAFIRYKTNEAAVSCISDIKHHPMCFFGLSNLIVKLATSKKEREEKKISKKNKNKIDESCKIFFKLLNINEAINNIFDLDKQIRLFIKIIFLKEYIPLSVELNENIKCAIVTFNNRKDCETFIYKFKNYCIYRKPEFNCIPYCQIKSQIIAKFINLDDIYNQNNIANNINDIHYDEYNKYNSFNILEYNNNLRNNNNKRNSDENKTFYNNNFNYNKINNYFNPTKQSHNFKNNHNFISINQFTNNNSFNLNNDINNKNYISNINDNINNKYITNINDNGNYHYLNINTNNTNNYNENNDIIKTKKENNKILLKPSEFNSIPKCIYNADMQEVEKDEEILLDISDTIYQIAYEKYPSEASKITGMIKEFGIYKMNLLLSKPEDLNNIIEKAYKMIIEEKNL